MAWLLDPLTRAVTYTRWLHMLIGSLAALICAMVWPGFNGRVSVSEWAWVPLIPVPLLLAAAFVPAMRLVEGLQAQIMLIPGPHARTEDVPRSEIGIAARPSVSLRDRLRTAVWLVFRLEVGTAVALTTAECVESTLALIGEASGQRNGADLLIPVGGPRWFHVLLVPVPLIVLFAVVWGAGSLMTVAAGRLLGPSPAERMAALEELTERLLEGNRIARELHDSIGHALTVVVVQAGAAQAAARPEFTARALSAIEETGRTALEELDRVLRGLREDGQSASARPLLDEAEQLLESARATGTEVEAEILGSLGRLPGPVSREGYRILQEGLTNALRHAESRPVRVRIAVTDEQLELDVHNPLGVGQPGSGSGLQGIRERVALLGGRVHAAADDSEWRLLVRLPIG
ncbi:sensor histidine kinase [Streptomyces naphthomycinicus]|uniref:sensor histidine kinase n=1 Tax=Streptomyces naphthomycinicus TaxID=2872625 RepID=UPI001CED64E7|nr:histidine kinase [Streptomyces sp. TML10]